MRLLCVQLPHFPWRCELRRHPALAGRPAIVTYTEGSQRLVLEHSPDLEGLPPGMPLQPALARYGDARLIQADMPLYRSVWSGILDALEGVSPLVEDAGPGCACLGVDGLHLIYPDDSALIDAVRGAVPDIFAPRIGIAGNRFLAYLAARRCPPGGHRVLSGDVALFLRDLPVDVLPVSLKSRDRLREFGLAALGQVAAMSPGPFQSQFGPEGKKIWELACGLDATPLYPRFMEESIEMSASLPSVTVSLDAILVAMESLLAGLFAGSALRGRGIRSLTLWTRTWNAEHWERPVSFKEPALDVKTSISRLKRVMEDYPQPGPVEQVGLRITALGHPLGRQKSLFSDIRAREHLAEDIRQLELKLGNPQVYTVKEVEPWSRIPERRYALTPAGR
jgi:DNA polymerase-4/protein ImuB